MHANLQSGHIERTSAVRWVANLADELSMPIIVPWYHPAARGNWTADERSEMHAHAELNLTLAIQIGRVAVERLSKCRGVRFKAGEISKRGK